jgi:lysozyme
MTISDKCLKMIIHHEGKRNKPYRCPALLFTIGVGHVIYPEQAKIPMAERMNFQIKPQDDRFYSDEEVFEILRKDLARFVAGVLRLCPNTVNNQNHLDCLVSFSFNVGLGSLQRSQVRLKYNREDFDGAMNELLTWNKAGGKVLKGLDNRRKDEKALFLS